MDLVGARTRLDAHGTGVFRIFSGEWRRANRLTRSVLTRPDAPLAQTLSTLDALTRGQKARSLIEREQAFAASIFGAAWRGERSGSGPLLALVEWVRSDRKSTRLNSSH